MRPECIQAVSAAMGRPLTKAETDGLEERVRAGMVAAARENLEAFQGLSVQARIQAGAERAALAIKADAADAKRQAQKDLSVHDANARVFDEWVRAGRDPHDLVDRMLRNVADNRSPVASLESRIDATFYDYARRLTATLEAAHPQFFGLIANRDGAMLVMRELYGEDTGNALARAAAEEWTSTIDAAVAQFKSAGGRLNRLTDWRAPQYHDQHRVFAAGKQAWADFVMPRLDRRKYVSINGRAMTDEEVRAVVEHAWDSITSGGANDREPGQQPTKTKAANRYLDHRVIHFRDAESWITYEEQFGTGDLWHAMTAHLRGMSRSIGLIETFGSNPEAEFRYWQDYAVQQSTGKRPDPEAPVERANKLFRYLAGQSDGVANATWAAVMDRTRNVLTAARLGSAVVSSIPDIATLLMTARYNRLSGLEALANSMKLLTSPEHRAELQRYGLMVESSLAALHRYQVDALGPSYSSRLANFTMEVQGMNLWTSVIRGGYAATHMHALANITRNASTLGELHPGDARNLRAAGVTDTDLAVWHAAQPENTGWAGALLTADAIYRVSDEAIAAIPVELRDVTRSPDEVRRQAAQRLLGMLITEQHMAVTEPGAGERFQMGAGTQRGSVSGEVQRSFWQFKSFPWSLIQKHIVQRGLSGHDTAGGKATYIGGLTIAATLLGALAMEANDLLTGKDPRPLWGDDPRVVARNWGAAFLKGGASGIYGEFLASEVSPSGGTALSVLLGPVGGLLHDAIGLTAGNAIQLAKPGATIEDTKAGAEAVRMVRGVTPGASLWYGKAALDHLIFNQLTEAMNPGHLERVRDRAERNFGSEQFWPAEELLPERAPNLRNIVGRQ